MIIIIMKHLILWGLAILNGSVMARKNPMIVGEFKESCPYGPKGPFCTKNNYHNFLPPNYISNGSTVVNVSFGVQGLSSIDSFAKDFTLFIHVTLAWEDHRIKWNLDDFNLPEDQELILNIEHLE